MSCCGIAGSSWLSPTTPKFITNVAACSFRPMDNISSMGLHRNNTSSPIASYGRRWYNPERRGSISPAPEIVLHWVEADALSGGQHQGVNEVDGDIKGS
ncbi:hypothetical protein P3S68_017690 [Capsicum galapagoense]